VQRVLNIYQNSTKLVELSDAIYQSVLVALGRMLEYLRHNACRKVLKALIKQQSFQSSLVIQIEDIAAARDEFNTEAELCHKESLQKLQEATERGGDRVEDAILNLKRVVAISRREQERSSQMIHEYFDLMSHDFSDLTKEVGELKQLVHLQTVPIALLIELLKSNPRVIDAAYDDGTCCNCEESIIFVNTDLNGLIPVKRLPAHNEHMEYSMKRRPSLLHHIHKPKGKRRSIQFTGLLPSLGRFFLDQSD
jgi:hypothetical protein